MNIINLDHISYKPLHPAVKRAMIDAINADLANPSSQHKSGEIAAEKLDEAREAVAALIRGAQTKRLPHLRAACLDALGTLCPPKATPVVRGATRSRSRIVVGSAQRALRRCGW